MLFTEMNEDPPDQCPEIIQTHELAVPVTNETENSTMSNTVANELPSSTLLLK
jgi:hypothetical protein